MEHNSIDTTNIMQVDSSLNLSKPTTFGKTDQALIISDLAARGNYLLALEEERAVNNG